MLMNWIWVKNVIIIIIIIIIIIVIIPCEIFPPALADGFSSKSEWQQVSLGLQDSP